MNMNHQHHNHNEEQDYDKHAGHSVAMFRNKFWVCLILTVPVLLYSENVARWLHISPPSFPGSMYIPFILSSVIFFYGGWVFIKGAIGEIKNRLPGMMTLISLAIVTSYVYSLATIFGLKGEGFFWELATLVTIMLLGHWLEMASVAKAESALDAIAKLLPDKADKLVNGKPRTVLVSELKVGDLVLVRPGTNIPIDGAVTDGTSSVDEAAFSGESKPVTKSVHDEVVAGTTNQDGALTVKVTKLGEDTALAGVMRLVKEAQASKSNTQVLADKAAFWLTIVALSAGVLTFVYWSFAKDSLFALERAVTVLIIACPHALGLAIPLVVSISTALSAKNGLLVRKRLALESARDLEMVLFDKTGTLTEGKHGVTDIITNSVKSESELLTITASLEQKSEHIVGAGIVAKAKEQKVNLKAVTDFKAIPGYGVQGKIGNKAYLAVSQRYIQENDIKVPDKLSKQMSQAAQEGKTEVYLVEGKEVIGALALADIIRPESIQAITELKELGIKSAMITGDSDDVASYVAKQLNLDEYFANVKPEEKSEKVTELVDYGNKVAMVGDGVNDAPALTAATIGIAIGAGTDVAIKSADIILVKSNPLDVVKVIHLSQASYKKMIQNLIWATGYNVIAIPLAAGVLYSFGVLLAPAVGAVLMSVSTIVVAANAQLLRRTNL